MIKHRLPFRPRSSALALEPRVLFDGAAAVAADAHLADWHPVAEKASASTGETTAPNQTTPMAPATAQTPVVPTVPSTLLVVDARVADYQSLLGDLPGNVMVRVIKVDESGIDAITQAIDEASTVQSLQIISHGSSGRLALGQDLLDSTTLSKHRTPIDNWARHLSTEADILLYGCDIAAGTSGSAFLNKLAALSGADVAASSDATGSAARNGNWLLERQTGPIDSRLAVSNATLASYDGLLAAPVIGATTPTTTIDDNLTATPFSTVSITDADGDASQILTVTLSDPARGRLTNLAGGTYDVGAGVYTFSGTASSAQAAIRGLIFTPTANRVLPGDSEATGFTIAVDDGSTITTDNTTTVIATSINDTPIIGGTSANQPVNDNASLSPFAGITIVDPDTAQAQTVTISLDAATKGSLSNLAGGTYDAGLYTISGTASATQAAIRGLVFTPTANRVGPGNTETTVFTISVSDGGTAVTDSTTTVIATSINDTPTAVDDAVAIAEDTVSITGNLLANDTDPDTSDPHAVTSVRVGGTPGTGTSGSLGSPLSGLYGRLTLAADGGYIYNLANDSAAVQALGVGQQLTEQFNYTLQDSTGATASAVITVTIDGTNDAPVATASTFTVTTPVPENATDPENPGTPVSSLLLSAAGASLVSDIDASDTTPGIAVYGSSLTNGMTGTWQYKLSGGIWTDFTPAVATATLLPHAALLRFVADAKTDDRMESGAATLQYHAWDGRLHAPGSTTSVADGDRGGSSAISLNSLSATINVASRNDLPTLTQDTISLPERGPGSTIVLTGNASPQSVGTEMLRLADPDNSAEQILYRLEVLPGNGSLSRNGVLMAVGTLFSQADLASGAIRYSYTGSELSADTTDTFRVSVRDGAGGVIGVDGAVGANPWASITLNITDVNAQVGVGSTSFSTSENTVANPVTLTLTGLLPGDADAAASPAGYPRLAVTSLPGQGTLNYWDGSTYTALTAAGLKDAGATVWLTTAALTAHPLQYVPAMGEPIDYGSQVTFGVFVDDGGRPGQPLLATTGTGTVTITVSPVNDPPTPNNAALSIAGGTSSTIAGFAINDVSSTGSGGSRLGIQDDDSTTALRQVYTLTAMPTKGWLLLNGLRLGVGSTFTQADVIDSKLSYHNLSSASDHDSDGFSYKINDSDGGIGDGSFNINLTTLHAPDGGDGGTLDKLLPEGDAQIISNVELQGSDAYTLTTATTHGTLQKWDGTAWTLLNTGDTFSQGDIDANHIRYVNDGAVEPLAYTPSSQIDSFAVSRTGGTVSGSSTFMLTVTPVNDTPSITQITPALNLSEGTPADTLPTTFDPGIQANVVKLTTAQLQWRDPESEQFLSGTSIPTEDPAKLRYVIDTAFSDGSQLVQWNGSAWATLAVGERFAAQDVADGKIAYWHNPHSETRTNTLTVHLIDGGSSGGAEAASALTTVTFNVTAVNDSPVAHDGNFALDEGAVRVISTGILSVTDSDNTVADFNAGTGEGYYELTQLPTHGKLYLNGVEISSIGSPIAYSDIAGNRLEYRHDGTEPSGYSYVDSFKYRSADPSITGNEATVAIDIRPVNDPPIVHNNAPITVAEGSLANTIDAAHLGSPGSQTDADNTSLQTQFRITAGVQYGTLYLDRSGIITTLGTGAAFTLDDIQKGYLKYTHNGSEPHLNSPPFKDGFDFTISDASGMTEPPGHFVINLTALNDAPTLTPTFFGTTAYVEDGVPVAVGATVLFSDPDLNSPDGVTPTLAGGTLEITIADLQAGDLLSVIHTGTGPGQIGVSGTDISYASTVIGTIDGVRNGIGGQSLLITFNDHVTSDVVVQALIRAIAFSNSDTANPATPDRNLTIVYDADGASADATQKITGTATVSVARANDAPTLAVATVDLANDGYTLNEDSKANGGILVSTFVAAGSSTAGRQSGISDVDIDNMPAQSSKIGIAVTAATTANGHWEYALDNGSGGYGAWQTLTGTADSAARLLRPIDKVRFVPDTLNGTTATFNYRAWDQFSGAAGETANTGSNGGTTAFSSATDSASIIITPVNDAPTGLGNTTVPTIYEDNQSAPGLAIAALDGLNFQDVDSGASLYGIAVVGNTANAGTQGAWQYSSDGTNWRAIGSVDDTSNALVLAASTKVRFVPVADYNGQPPALTTRALDNTYGGGSSTWDGATEMRVTLATGAGSRGGTTAIAEVTNTIDITVLATNDAPTIASSLDAVVAGNENTLVTMGSNFTLTDADLARNEGTGIGRITLGVAHGAFLLGSGSGVTVTSGNQASDRGAGDWGGGTSTLVFTGTLAQLKVALDGLSYIPGDNPATSEIISVTLNDLGNAGVEDNGGSSVHSASTTINVSGIAPVNDAPVITRPIGVTAIEDTDYTFASGAISITDVDAGSGLVKLTLGIPSGMFRLSGSAGIYTDASGSTSYTVADETGSLTIYGTVSKLNAALSGLVYRPAANANSVTLVAESDRTLSIAVDDMGYGEDGNPATRLTDSKAIVIAITPVNDQPLIVGPTASSDYSEQATATVIGAGVTVSDPIDDSQCSGATAVISTNYRAGDMLAAVTTGTLITATYDGTGTLTLSGVDSIDNYPEYCMNFLIGSVPRATAIF